MRNSFLIGILVTSLLSSSLAGCDFIHSVSRVGPASAVPPQNCVKDALRSISEVKEVRYQFEEGRQPITLGGLERPDRIYRYTYRYKGLNGHFLFLENYKNEVEFKHTYIDINQVPTQESTLGPVPTL